MNIIQFINNPTTSNTFLVFKELNQVATIIDPGTEDCKELLECIEKNQLIPKSIILTHEHFDHIWGVNTLREKFPEIKLISNSACSKLIQTENGNLSKFFGNEFTTAKADIEINEDESFELDNFIIEIIQTPGHSEGSICIKIENNLFTGDTYIPNLKTVTKLPNSNKKELIKSIEKLNLLQFSTIFPGHGESSTISMLRF